MKKILTLILLVCTLTLSATNYYFRPDGVGTNTGLSDAQAWNLAKFNSVFSTLAAGDSCLFKRGTVFIGTIQISRSGASGNHIIIGAYGATNLAKPIITGFNTLTSWTNTSGNIWESAVTTAKTTLNLLTVNGVNTPMGRYPNLGTTNGGYLTYESSTVAGTIIDNQLTATPDWDGAEVIVRKNAWVTDRGLITNHTGTSVTFTGGSSYIGYNNWGYFIQNDLRTLDAQGEWFLDKATKKVSIYTTVNPSGLTVKIPVYDTLIYASARSYITFSNIVFEGGNLFGAYLAGGTDIKFLDCTIRFIGRDGIKNDNLSYLTINRCTMSDINDNVLYGNGSSSNVYFGYTTVTRNGLIVGTTGSGDGHNFGVSLQGPNSTMEYCNVSKMGYLGMIIAGNNSLVRNNIFDSICIAKDDGSAIYVSGALTTVMSNRIIRNNIVSNSIGVLVGKAPGTAAQGRGIYVDGTGNNVLIDSNTVFNCNTAGVYLGFYTYNITMRGNTFINNTAQISITENNTTDNNFVIEGNVLASTTNQSLIYYGSSEPRVDRPVSSLGTWNGNYYIKPFGNKQIMTSVVRVDATRSEYKGYTTTQWATYDANMKFPPVTITPYVITNYVTTNQYVNGTFNANITGVRGFYYSGVYALTWDNTNQITAGTAKMALTTLGTQNNTMAFAVPVNNVEVGKRYITEFDIKGSMANSAVDVHLRDHISPYPYLMANYNYYPMGNTTTRKQILLEPVVTASADVFIQVTDADASAYIDNFTFREVNITKANPADYLIFDYNTTGIAKTINFDGRYKDIDGNNFISSKVINPYKSTLLFKDTTYVVNPYVLPTITVDVPYNVTSRSISLYGEVVFDGGDAVTERGIVWALTPNPTVSSTKITAGTGVGSFLSSVTGLQPNTTYFIRSYGVNQAGTAYSSQTIVKTSDRVTLKSTTGKYMVYKGKLLKY